MLGYCSDEFLADFEKNFIEYVLAYSSPPYFKIRNLPFFSIDELLGVCEKYSTVF